MTSSAYGFSSPAAWPTGIGMTPNATRPCCFSSRSRLRNGARMGRLHSGRLIRLTALGWATRTAAELSIETVQALLHEPCKVLLNLASTPDSTVVGTTDNGSNTNTTAGTDTTWTPACP